MNTTNAHRMDGRRSFFIDGVQSMQKRATDKAEKSHGHSQTRANDKVAFLELRAGDQNKL
jgi:hypothetical protein